MLSELEKKMCRLILSVTKKVHGWENEIDKEQSCGLALALSIEAKDKGMIEKVIQFIEQNPNVEYDELDYFINPESFEDIDS